MSCVHNIRRMTISNYNYQSVAESHKRLHNIAIGDEMLIRVHPERFPLRTLKRLHTRHRSPYKVLKRFDYSAYELDIPHVLGSALCSTSRTDSLSHFHEATKVFSSFIVVTITEETHLMSLWVLGSISPSMPLPFASGEFFEAGENWCESLALYLYLGFFPLF